DVIPMGAAHRPGIAEIVDLHRCGTAREYGRPRAFGNSVEVDCDLDLQVPDEARDLRIAELADIDEAVEGRLQTLAHRTLYGRPRRNRDDLETASIMMLEQA